MSVEPHCIEHTETANDIQFEAYCHVFDPTNSSFSYCGIPRAEQPRHGIFNPSVDAVYCSKCGLKRCPRCLQAELARKAGQV